MTYVDRRPCADHSIRNVLRGDPDLILKPYFLKAIEYQHEREVRFGAHCPKDARGLMVTEIDVKNLIREIVISPLLPPDEADAILATISKHTSNLECQIRPSNLVITSPGSHFIRALAQGIHGSSDSNMDFSAIPPALRAI